MKLGILSVVLLSSLSHALPSSPAIDKTARSPKGSADLDIPQLFSEGTTAKIWRVALNLLDEVGFPAWHAEYFNIPSFQTDPPKKSRVLARIQDTMTW